MIEFPIFAEQEFGAKGIKGLFHIDANIDWLSSVIETSKSPGYLLYDMSYLKNTSWDTFLKKSKFLSTISSPLRAAKVTVTIVTGQLPGSSWVPELLTLRDSFLVRRPPEEDTSLSDPLYSLVSDWRERERTQSPSTLLYHPLECL